MKTLSLFGLAGALLLAGCDGAPVVRPATVTLACETRCTTVNMLLYRVRLIQL